MSVPAVDTRAHGAGTNPSFSITIGANSNRYLLLMAFHTSNTALTVTVDGSSTGIVHIGSSVYDSNVGITEIYGLVAPATGSRSLVFSTGGADTVFAYAVSLYNVDQSTPYENFNSGHGTSTPQSISVTTSATDLAIAVGVGCYGEGSAPPACAGGFANWDNDQQGSGPTWGEDGWINGVAGSVTVGWNTGSAGDSWSVAGVAIRYGAGAAAAQPEPWQVQGQIGAIVAQ